jgi:hypothetical protein
MSTSDRHVSKSPRRRIVADFFALTITIAFAMASALLIVTATSAPTGEDIFAPRAPEQSEFSRASLCVTQYPVGPHPVWVPHLPGAVVNTP